MVVRGRRRQRPRVVHPLHATQLRRDQLIRARLDPLGRCRVRRSAVRRVVLEAAILGRIVRRRDHDAVGQPALPPSVVGQDRVAQRRRRRIAQLRVDHHLDIVRRQHLQRRRKRRLRQRMRVLRQEQRPVRALAFAILDNRLRDRRDVIVVEAGVRTRCPRWPDVPNATRWAGFPGSGCSA